MDDPFLQSREWRTVRMRALERDGGKCACCGKTAKDGVVLNVDHIKPRIRYPELALTVENLQVLCDACNHGKGNWSERDWRPQGASREATAPAPERRARSVEFFLIIQVLLKPDEALSPLFDDYTTKDRTADERCLARLIKTVRADPQTWTTPMLLQWHAEEFGDILAAALTYAEFGDGPRA